MQVAKPLRIDSNANRTVSQIAAMARRMKRREGLGLLIIDYLQLITSDGSDAQLNQITSALRSLSLSLHTHVLLLSQLSRKPEDRPDRRPSIADLRGTGGIEQDCVNVTLIYRPGFYPELVAAMKKKDPDKVDDLLRRVELIFCKTRNGPTGSTPPQEIEWDGETASFYDRHVRQSKPITTPGFEEDDF